MGHKYASERKLPRRDEGRHAAAEAAPHRARKDRKRWCRGKVGVEHVAEVRLSKWGVYWQTKDPARPACSWRSWGLWPENAHPDHPEWHWSCNHERGCATCGKILDPFLGRDCPLYSLDLPMSA